MSMFTTEVQNSLRLSCLLVNDGTKCLRQVFIDELQKKYNQNDLGTILTFPHVKQIIDDHKNGKNKKPRIINIDQYKLLYPKKKCNVETFDLTLICVLCNILCSIKIEIKGQGDISIGADISRIRTIRNRLFAHLTKLCMTTNEFESQWKELMHILVRLGGDQKEMEKWRTEPLSPQDYEDYKRYIASLIENDAQSIQVLNDNILENQDSLRKIAENVDRFNAKLNHLVSLHEINNPEAQLSAIKQIMEELNAEHAERLMDSGIQDHLEDIKSEVNELKEMNSDILLSQLQIKSLLLQNKTDNVELESLHEIKCILERSKEAYKILLINKPTNVEDEEISKCSSALGCVPWDIIFDLDNRSRLDHGIHSKLTFSLSNVLGKDFIPCTYAETSKITDDYKERIAKGQCSLYVLANGCEELKIPSINENKLGKAATKISHLLDDIFEQIPTKKNILLAVLILGENNASYINRLIQLVKEVAESNEEKFLLSNSYVLTLYIHEDLDKTVENVNLWNYKHCGAPIAQLIYMFENLFCTAGSKDYFFPGKKGPCCFHSREMAQLKGTVELYHKKIGEIDIEGLNDEELEDKIQSIKENFLKGREITHEALFLNNKYQIFVVREEMTCLMEKIEESLESRKRWTSQDPLYFRLRHDASGGGTTSIRFVMYSLRNKYPCLMISKIRDNLFEILSKIKRESELPLLIVLDDNELSEKDAAFVHSRLRNMCRIKALVVHVQRGENNSEAASELPQQMFIPSTVTQTDRAAFNKLYVTSKKRKGLHKVFLFGLIAFCDEYERLGMHIDTCISECTFQQKHILQIVILIWKYCHMATKEQIVYMVEPQLGNSGNIFSNLGYGSDLLVCSNDNNEEIRPAHSCIIEPVLQKLIGESKKDQLHKFVFDIMDLFEKDFQGKKESTRILSSLFLQKIKEFRQRFVYWSQLVLDLQKYCGKEYVCNVLCDLEARCKKVNSPFLTSCQVLLSRYYMYEMKDIEKSLSTIKNVLKIEGDQSVRFSPVKESFVLNTYGFLLKRSLQITYESKSKLQVNVESFFHDVRKVVEEAVWAFQTAQKLNVSKKYGTYSELSFIGEAKVRVFLLQVCFELICKRDHEKFAIYIKSSDDIFIKESELEALEAVQKLEILLMNQRILLDDPLLTMDTIRKIQFNCLKLHFDQTTSIQKVMANIPENVPYDIGTMVRRDIHKIYDVGKSKYDKIPWQDLQREQLEKIIETVGKRIHSSKLLRCNYRDMLYAMIYIRQLKGSKKKLGKYNIEYGIGCAKQWIAKYKDDIDGHFFLGSLLLVKGLQSEQGISQIREGLECLDRCNELCNKYKIEHYRRKRFAIGILGNGLGSLVPLSLLKENHDLSSFLGRQINKSTVKVRNYDITCYIDHSSDVIGAHQQQLLRFNIAIAYDKILAINPQIENEA